jgi:hypothetical protein
LIELYFSVDVEFDGPVPGVHSMSAFAFVVAGGHDGTALRGDRKLATSFYRELRPISDEFDPETLAVSGLDRDRLKAEGADPAVAMRQAAEWVANVSGGAAPVMVGYPLGCDWMWLTWYFLRFCGRSPFGHSQGYDTKTAYAVKAGIPLTKAGRSKLPAGLASMRPHSHNALDDAAEQAEVFLNVAGWNGRK